MKKNFNILKSRTTGKKYKNPLYVFVIHNDKKIWQTFWYVEHNFHSRNLKIYSIKMKI
jgi:hypothetical protein